MRLNGEDHLESGTLAFSRGDMDFAMQLINDGGADAEPQSGALTETIAPVNSNCSESYLLVLFLSTSTTFIRFSIFILLKLFY